MNKTLFISDLHLSAERQDIAQCFFDFMKHEANEADALYILGDLFEVWLGDDDQSPFSNQVASAISQVAAKLPVYFIHGNRDFAIGNKFASKCNMTLLPEQYVIDLYGTPTLISHGDELCTRDIEYMKFRKKARGWWWPRVMKAIPLTIRRKLAQKGRKTSQENQKHLSAEIMDVTPSEVLRVMSEYQVQQFIHGHTHRPNIHQLEVNNKAAQRIVLGDWYTQGSVLVASENGVTLETRTFA